MTEPLPTEEKLSAFARRLGVRASYVTKLKDADRLVLTDDGKRVKVAESLARIEETKDPNRADVHRRHARKKNRAAAGAELKGGHIISEKQIALFRCYLNGDSFEKCGSRFEISGSRAQQIVQKVRRHLNNVLPKIGIQFPEDLSYESTDLKKHKEFFLNGLILFEKHNSQIGPPAPAAEPPAKPPRAPRENTGFAWHRARKMQADADKSEMERDVLAGRLVEISTVRAAGVEVGTALRAALENLEDQLAPLLAPVTDEDRVRQVLHDHFEVALKEASAKIERLGQST